MKLSSMILFATAILLSANVDAQQRSEVEMAQIAMNFLTPKATRAAVQITPVEVTPELSIYTRASGGWVIVSGDERTRGAILAYSNEGQFDLESENVRDWVEGYREQIRSLANVRADGGTTEPGTPVVGPLITTKWKQKEPYRLSIPTYINEYQGKTATLHYDTGCTPTAIAQIMNYWQWPKRGQGKHTNIHFPSATVDFSQSEYDWDNMLDEYIRSYSHDEYIYDNDSNVVDIKYYGNWNDAQVGAVAKLMYDCGVALDAQYGIDGTTVYSQDIPKALCAYFDYSTDAKYLERNSYSGDWDALLRSELDAGRPICYSGTDRVYGGHAFVCDGYDDQGYFHFNIGWGGEGDGYYLTSAINLTNYDFTSNQDIIYGIHPAGQDDKVILSDGLYYRKFDDGLELFIADNIGLDEHVIIPDKVNDMPVTSIAEGAFNNNSNLKSLEIGDNVKTIGQQAFYHCSSLDTVTIGSSVKTIGSFAFDSTSIRHLVIPSSVELIDMAAFQLCTSLQSVVIGDGVKNIARNAFFNCTSLDTVIIGLSVEAIASFAFDSTSIRHLVIPSSVELIDTAAFEKSTSLQSVVIGDGVKNIANMAFYSCTSLDTVTIGSSVQSIEYGAFASTAIRHLVIPSSVERIDEFAFQKCKSLKSAVIGDGVKTISDNAFNDCISLAYVTFGSSVERIGEYSFSSTIIRDLVLPSSLVEIGYGAFLDCYDLKTVSFGESLNSIGTGAFCNCYSLDNVVLPNSLKTIGYAAFGDCESLTTLVIGSGVKTIEDAAFSECFKLTSVTCLGTTPPACDESKYGVFWSTDISKATLYIPKGSKIKYQLTNPWKGFGTFKEINPTGVEVPSQSAPDNEYYLNSRIKIVDGKKYLLPVSAR